MEGNEIKPGVFSAPSLEEVEVGSLQVEAETVVVTGLNVDMGVLVESLEEKEVVHCKTFAGWVENELVALLMVLQVGAFAGALTMVEVGTFPHVVMVEVGASPGVVVMVVQLVGTFAGRVSRPNLAMREMESLHKSYFMWLNR